MVWLSRSQHSPLRVQGRRGRGRTNEEPACCCLLQFSETEGKGQDTERVTVRQGTQPKIQHLAESLSFRFVRNCLGERNIFTLDVKQEGLREGWRGAQEWAQPAAVIGSSQGLPSSTRMKLFLLSLSLKKLLCIWVLTCVCACVCKSDMFNFRADNVPLADSM